ncbi:MAG: TlpA family protein disulfide reductase [Fibrobacter sp.]|nr:TlpA family protein disulfide reductase [Fibrobacter sp.]
MVKLFSFELLFLFCAVVFGAGDKLLSPITIAPTFSLPDLQGDRVSLRYYCGDTLQKPHLNNTRHFVILSFWATYCVPCQKEIPELMQFAENHKGDSIKIFLISIDKEGAEIVAPFIKEKGYTLPVLLDPYRKTAERYGVNSVPSLFVIDPYGFIQYSAAGYYGNVSLDKKLDWIIQDIRSGYSSSNTKVKSIKAAPQMKISADKRWDAIWKVECGNPVAEIANLLHITPEELASWRIELKKAAFSLWDSDSTRN